MVGILNLNVINPVTKVNEYTNSDLMVYASWTEMMDILLIMY